MDELVQWLERQISSYSKDLELFKKNSKKYDYTLGAKEAYEFTIKQIIRNKSNNE
jgi:hypothetical protein